MPDILELALRHVIAHGMTKEDGAIMLAAFAEGEGLNIKWAETAQRLSKELADRIEQGRYRLDADAPANSDAVGYFT